MTPSDIQRIKDLLPTTLGSEEIREQLAADILRRSVFSARMASVPYLAKVRDVCAALSAGAINQADARNTLEALLEQMGHSMRGGKVEKEGGGEQRKDIHSTVHLDSPPPPKVEKEGGGEQRKDIHSTVHLDSPPPPSSGIANPISIRRLNLILDTQTQMAASVSRIMEQTEATVYANPAWELTRLGHRDVPRPDWAARWRAASAAVGDEGVAKGTSRFIALKSSPVWQALGEGAGGYRDTLRNPYPPFAYGSGMGWIAVDRETCHRIGLTPPDDAIDVESTVTLTPDEQSLADAVERYGFPEIAEGILA